MATVIARQFAVTTAKVFAQRGSSFQSPPAGLRDYRGAALVAADVVERITGFALDPSSLVIEGVDRQGWAERNIDSYAALIQELTPRDRPNSIGMAELNGVALGILLGNFSGKVLGQYDPAFVTGSPAVWMVDDNVDRFAHNASLDPDEVALWVLVHELTHRGQFHGVPWFRERLLGLMTQLFRASSISPVDLLGDLFARLRGLGSGQPVDVATLLLPERLRSVAQDATTIMTVAEGHAEWVMRQVPTTVVPHREAFEGAIDARRNASGVAKLVAELSGLASKRSQYSLGLRFFEAIAEVDVEAPRRVFSAPPALPTAEELREPTRWLRRMSLDGAPAGRPS